MGPNKGLLNSLVVERGLSRKIRGDMRDTIVSFVEASSWSLLDDIVYVAPRFALKAT